MEVVGTGKNGRVRRPHVTPRVSPSRAPVLSFTYYFQAPTTLASDNLPLSRSRQRCIASCTVGRSLGSFQRQHQTILMHQNITQAAALFSQLKQHTEQSSSIDFDAWKKGPIMKCKEIGRAS